MDRYMEYLTRFTLDYLEALVTAARGQIDVIRADDDLGTMDRLMISPANVAALLQASLESRLRPRPPSRCQGGGSTPAATSGRCWRI